MAGFEVTFYGRIWVTPEVLGIDILLAQASLASHMDLGLVSFPTSSRAQWLT
jgi:hypothetical protein